MTPLIPSYLLYSNSCVGQERAEYFTLLEPRPTEGSLAGLVLGHLRYCTGGVFCLQVQCERECMSQLIDLTLQRKEVRTAPRSLLHCFEVARAYHDTHIQRGTSTLTHNCTHPQTNRNTHTRRLCFLKCQHAPSTRAFVFVQASVPRASVAYAWMAEAALCTMIGEY